MKINEITTKSNKAIIVADDVFDYSTRHNFYQFVNNSLFSTKGYDTELHENKKDYNLVSKYSESDLENMGFLQHPNFFPLLKYVDGFFVQQIRVNLSTLNDQNRFHVDVTNSNGVTLLYYPNMNWNLEWGGYTLFANEQITEIEHTVAYVPGRVIIFNGAIPHCIAAPTNLAPSYRYSLAIQYCK